MQEKPRVPFIIRRKWYFESKSWELFAAFPTIAADSSSWYNWQAEAENGDWFSCSLEYWNASQSVRGIDPARVAAFEKRVRDHWENDSDFPCVLWRYERKAPWMDETRASEWRQSRAA